MKKLFTFLSFVFLAVGLRAQINVNPDPNGEPWIAGKIPDYTPEYIAKLDEIPELELTSVSSQTPLPSLVDNSEEKYMRLIFPQHYASCGPSACVGYNYTYEINRLRDIDVSNPLDSSNWYPPSFTYNFMNQGQGSYGADIFDCWDIIKEQGCPTVPVYGKMFEDSTHWMSGYHNYDTSMYNRLISYSKITVVDTTGLKTLKHWISDHNEGADVGGLANFAGLFGNPGYDVFPAGTPEAGKSLVTHFGTGGGHELTIVGYNDSVRYDFNDDGFFTNTVDLNHDHLIDMRDWEYGAVKVANSWGLNYLNYGYVYVPYRLLAERDSTVGILQNEVYVLHLDTAKPYNRPEFVLKLKLEQLHRNKVSYDIGYGSDACDTVPDEIKLNFPFSSHGGPFPMQGQGNEDPMETEFDFSYYFDQFFGTNPLHFGKVFLKLYHTGSSNSITTIHEVSLVDYRWNETFELSYDDLPIEITTENDPVIMGIEYDLLPFEMRNFNQEFNCNKICRRHCRIYDDVSRTLSNGINVDFYNGTLVVEEGSTLIIGDSVTLRAMRGADSLIVYGNLQIGDHVKFLAEEGASFIIDIHNPQLFLSLNDAYFNNITFSSFVDTLDVANSTFINSSVEFKRASDNYYSLFSSRFYNTYVKADVEQKITEAGQITIADCQFHNSTNDSAILIEGYPNFVIHDDSLIYANGDGIDIYNSGSSVGLKQTVYNCYILDSVNQEEDISSGIKIYHSYVSVTNNLIVNNTFGVSCLDRSNIYLTGNQSAQSPNETQQIINNFHNQVFIIEGSFPNDFHWNVIYNSDLYHDTLVTLHTRYVSSIPIYNVENNYWGDNFDPYQDLHPTNQYDWTPVWTPPWINPKSTTEDESLFAGAKQAIIDGDYAEAESNFKEIIEDYPESPYFQASIKELLVLKRIYDHDFTGLKNYLDTVPAIQQDSAAMDLAAHVANWCNIENEDYSTAISWFENQIENPPSFEDSIFAVIDLGYTYMLMEEGGSRGSSYIGRYPEYKPVSRQGYEKNRDYLIDLLFKSYAGQHPDQNLTGNDVTTFNLTQNFPNPFRESTDIIFCVPVAAQVSVKVYNLLGALVAVPYDHYVESGEQRITFTPQNLPEGIYYCSLEVNNERKDVKKIILLK